MLECEVRRLDNDIKPQIEAQPMLEPLRSIKGVGPVLQATLACQLPELGISMARPSPSSQVRPGWRKTAGTMRARMRGALLA